MAIAYEAEHGRFTANYDDLVDYGWKREPDLVYDEISLGPGPDGRPGFTAIVRPIERGRALSNMNTAAAGIWNRWQITTPPKSGPSSKTGRMGINRTGRRIEIRPGLRGK